jgi:hypothetical protein
VVGRLAESRSSQKEVATKLADLLDQMWLWIDDNGHTLVDSGIFRSPRSRWKTRTGKFQWGSHLRNEKLRERIVAMLKEGTRQVREGKLHDTEMRREAREVLWQEFGSVKTRPGRYYH